nr:hypothetical protein [Coxiella-like endosymbiont]
MKGTFILPNTIVLAFLGRLITKASSGEEQLLKTGLSYVVGNPTTLKDSLTIIRRPNKDNRSLFSIALSIALYAIRARSKSPTATALIFLSSNPM